MRKEGGCPDLKVLNSIAAKLGPITGFPLTFRPEAVLPENLKRVAQIFGDDIRPAMANQGGVFTEREVSTARLIGSYLGD